MSLFPDSVKSAQNGSPSESHSPLPHLPQSRNDLAILLASYHRLLGLLKAHLLAREKSDFLPHLPSPDESLVAQKKQYEDKLLRVAALQHDYNIADRTFRDDLTAAVSKLDPDLAAVDTLLLASQIASLQLLSRDYDLPLSLQRQLRDASANSTANGKTDPDPPISRADAVVSQWQSLDNASFMEKARALGVVDDTVGDTSLAHSHNEKSFYNKLARHMSELENVPANLGSVDCRNLDVASDIDHLKIKALIELKSLRLLSKQKQIKRSIIVHEASQAKFTNPDLVDIPLGLQEKRSFNVRAKLDIKDPHLLAFQLEELKKLEHRKLQHQLHVSKVEQILASSEDISNRRYAALQYREVTLWKQISAFHQATERDESKKLEKTAKQRLQALKANDEEAYIKLLDQTKDHRITHLLKQTNQFLDTLSQQVRAQQAESDEPDAAPVVSAAMDGDESREKIDYYQVAHRIKEEVKEQPLILVGGKLKEYQVKGLQWMVSLYNNKLNGILADEMGLGKTIQSISLIAYLIEFKREDKFLVIVPLSTITNWTLEFEKWAPSINLIVYKGSPANRKSMHHDIRMGNFQVMLTTYEYIIRERPMLAKFKYSHMIIDEGHRMKNATSKLSITLKTYYRTKNRLILTGTPLQNNLPELWALLNFVLPRIFNSVKLFDEWFNTPFANTGNQEKIELTEEESLLVIRRLHKVLRPFLLRRLKKDVEKDLPDKVEKVLKCNLSGLQYVLYQQMLKHNAVFVGASTTGTGAQKSGIKGLNNKIMQLRKICNHPFVFEEVETILNSSRLTNDMIWRVSGKFELLDRVLPKFQVTGHRVLLFFQMTQVMDIMEDFLRWKEMKYLRLDGATKADDRQDMLKLFNAPNSEYFCFLLSTRAGGLGLNLQTADTVIIFDTDWNPHQDLQAQDRAHRIGQKNEVRILRLISNDSVEEVILERAHRKLEIDGKVIQAGKFDNKSTAEEQEEFLKKLLEAEANKQEIDDESMLFNEDELNAILARNEDERKLFTEMDTVRRQTDKYYRQRLIEKSELPPVFTEDIAHHFEKDTKELARKRDKKRVMYDDGLTEEQWLMAMDDDEDSVEDAIRRKEARRDRKRRRLESDGDSGVDMDDDDDGGAAAMSEASEDYDDDTAAADSGPRAGRRSRSKTPSTAPDSILENGDVAQDAEQQQCLALYEEIMLLKDENDGHDIHAIFLKLPSRKLYPDYYQIIKEPVALQPLRKRLLLGGIGSLEEFKAELGKMCANAKTYNEEGSFVYSDAEAIEAVIEKY